MVEHMIGNDGIKGAAVVGDVLGVRDLKTDVMRRISQILLRSLQHPR